MASVRTDPIPAGEPEPGTVRQASKGRPAIWAAGPGRTVRLIFVRGPGPDFCDRDRDLLTVLRPHLHQAYLDAERRRHPAPRLTARH